MAYLQFEKALAILAIFFLSSLPIAQAATITADSCSQEDVQAAIDSAQDGDTVLVLAGECEWEKRVSITKPITLVGQGYDSTVIDNDYSEDGLIEVNPGFNAAVRITGLYIKRAFQAHYASIYIRGSKTDSYVLNQVRIDHCKFEKGSNVILGVGRVEGVVDNNIFNNCNIAVRVNGDDNYSWRREIRPGTANALFIEDNTFIGDETNREVNLNEQIYQQGGARTVARYNLFDLSGITGSGAASFYDSHGNQSSSMPKCASPLSMFRGLRYSPIFGPVVKI